MATEDTGRLKALRFNLERRAEILKAARIFFQDQSFLEIETPIRVPVIAPEQFITPVRSEAWYLITSPELHMKRLLAAGYPRLFQFCHCFRQGERGRLHNPEFTMLEWYRAGGDYRQVIADTEQLVISLTHKLGIGERIKYQEYDIDLSLPWPETTVRDAFRKWAGWDPVAVNDPLRFDTDLCEKVIPNFPSDRPTVILDYPAPLASLARLKSGEPEIAERAEVFIGGLEIANGFSELTDRHEQEKRFREEIDLIEKIRGHKQAMPRKFLETMDDMPAAGGIALGFDRIIMLLCNAHSIDEVMPFTIDTI